jgi:hypothetical protein
MYDTTFVSEYIHNWTSNDGSVFEWSLEICATQRLETVYSYSLVLKPGVEC